MFAFNFDVLLPLVARLTLHEGAEVFGLIASVFGAGALCGALILATVSRARLALVLGGAAGFGAFQLLLAPQSSLAAVCLVLFVIGVFYVLWGSSALAVLQLAAPDHLRGRAASLYFFAFQGGAPLGGLWAGWLVSVGRDGARVLRGGDDRARSRRGRRTCARARADTTDAGRADHVAAATTPAISPAARSIVVVADQAMRDEPHRARVARHRAHARRVEQRDQRRRHRLPSR